MFNTVVFEETLPIMLLQIVLHNDNSKPSTLDNNTKPQQIWYSHHLLLSATNSGQLTTAGFIRSIRAVVRTIAASMHVDTRAIIARELVSLATIQYRGNYNSRQGKGNSYVQRASQREAKHLPQWQKACTHAIVWAVSQPGHTSNFTSLLLTCSHPS